MLVAHTQITPDNTYPYYFCPGNKLENNHKCNARMNRADALDAKIWGWLQSIFEQPDKLLRDLRAKQGEQQQANRLLQEQIQIIDGKIEDCQAQLSNLIDLYTATKEAVGDKAKNLFAEKEKALNQQIADMENERAERAERLDKVVISDGAIETIESLAADVRVAFPNATFEEKRVIVEALDVRGLVKPIDKTKSLVEVSCILDERKLLTIERFYKGKRGQDKQIITDSRTLMQK